MLEYEAHFYTHKQHFSGKFVPKSLQDQLPKIIIDTEKNARALLFEKFKIQKVIVPQIRNTKNVQPLQILFVL